MPDQLLSIVRWICLASIVIALLQATVLYGLFRRYLFEPWVAIGERRGGRPLPALLQDSRLQRAWCLVNAVLFGIVWWYLGTPSGQVWFRSAWR
jgi:hypothetical protein